MDIEPDKLDGMSRDALIELARRLGARRPELMTRVELRDEIIRLGETDENKRRRARGFLGIARDLVAGLVERGLNMPDAAALIRGDPILEPRPRTEAPVATVTLAEIYAAQGHTDRALAMLEDVLAKEPDHEIARRMRTRVSREAAASSIQASPAPLPEPDDRRSEPPVAMPVITPPPPAPVPAAPAPTVVDAVVTLVRDDAIDVYWELGEASLGRARRRAPDGTTVVKVVVMVPDWSGARRIEHELDAAAPRGSARCAAAPHGAVVRAALGWKSSHGFTPFTVGAAVTPATAASAGVERRALDVFNRPRA